MQRDNHHSIKDLEGFSVTIDIKDPIFIKVIKITSNYVNLNHKNRNKYLGLMLENLFFLYSRDKLHLILPADIYSKYDYIMGNIHLDAKTTVHKTLRIPHKKWMIQKLLFSNLYYLHLKGIIKDQKFIIKVHKVFHIDEVKTYNEVIYA